MTDYSAMFARVKSSRTANIFSEIVLIVVGINIALWFEGWFEDLQDAETEQLYLAGLRDDTNTDIASLDSIVEFSEAKRDKLGSILPGLPNLAQAPADEQAAALFEPSGYQFFYPSDFTYRSMQESGDFRLLRDPGTKRSILRLARLYRQIEVEQDNYLQALDDEYIPLIMRSFDMVQGRVTDPAVLDKQIFRNVFAYAYQDTQSRSRTYRAARKQAQELLELIESQLEAE